MKTPYVYFSQAWNGWFVLQDVGAIATRLAGPFVEKSKALEAVREIKEDAQ